MLHFTNATKLTRLTRLRHIRNRLVREWQTVGSNRRSPVHLWLLGCFSRIKPNQPRTFVHWQWFMSFHYIQFMKSKRFVMDDIITCFVRNSLQELSAFDHNWTFCIQKAL
jgi:hypothetical protein